MSTTTLELLLEHNRNRLVAISELEGIITSRNNRNGDITSLEMSLKLEEELYEIDVRAIKTLRDAVTL